MLFAAWLSVFCVPCLSCVISACCACSGPAVPGYLVLPAYAGGGGGPHPPPLCLHAPSCCSKIAEAEAAVSVNAPSWHPGGLFLTLAPRCCLQVILLGLMGLLDSPLWTGRLLSYCEVALLGFCCLGWRWGTPVLVTLCSHLVCSQCLHRKSRYLPGSGHYLTRHQRGL